MMHDSDYEEFIYCWKMVAGACIALALIGVLFGCSKDSYASLQSSCTDSVSAANDEKYARIEQLISESSKQSSIKEQIIIRDSIVMVMSEAGDIISREAIRITDKSVSQQELASMVQTKIDSIMESKMQSLCAIIEREQQIPVPVQRELSAWEKIQRNLLIPIILCFFIITLIWTFRKPLTIFIRRYLR